jgi:hypothetical protein
MDEYFAELSAVGRRPELVVADLAELAACLSLPNGCGGASRAQQAGSRLRTAGLDLSPTRV